jgi:hypothetical protein
MDSNLIELKEMIQNLIIKVDKLGDKNQLYYKKIKDKIYEIENIIEDSLLDINVEDKETDYLLQQKILDDVFPYLYIFHQYHTNIAKSNTNRR